MAAVDHHKEGVLSVFIHVIHLNEIPKVCLKAVVLIIAVIVVGHRFCGQRGFGTDQISIRDSFRNEQQISLSRWP